MSDADDLVAPAGGDDEEPLEVTVEMLAERLGEHLDFERGMRYAAPATLALVLVLAIVFAWEVGSDVLGSRESIAAAGALVRQQVVAGEWWRLGSAMFLHGSGEHLLGNVMALYVLGLAAEHAFGAPRFVLLYLVSGLAGSIASVVASPGPSVGASGAIFGLLGAVTFVLVRYRHDFHLRDKRIAIVLAVWAGYTILTGLTTPMIDNAAHVGGLLGGIAVAAAIRPRILGDRPSRP